MYSRLLIPLLLLLLTPHPALAAAITLSWAQPDRAALDTAWQEYIVPAGCRWLQVHIASTAGKLQWQTALGTGADNDAVGTDYLPIAADAFYEWRIPGTGYGDEHAKGTLSVYLAADSGTPTATVQCTGDGT